MLKSTISQYPLQMLFHEIRFNPAESGLNFLGISSVSKTSSRRFIGRHDNRPEFAETAESREMITGMAVEAHVRSALRANAETHGVNVTIECRAGNLRLTGIVVSENERLRTQEVAAAVPGVTAVDNALRVMRMPRIFPSSKT